ncbi:MAG: hypothetical protein HN542_09805 [Flavobacteriales bacterium]|jgi:hypothetical protein|nr:hypothetical protein [Flavobacteriales bacterium]NCG29819.1 hypothetical protein [Bacteroidota bacterium]MBT3963266.1 hypothetical protein [Flavobacteriales bacterium]MBT4704595.1 hypothetical protein [Flavobacteriales bacterium]MBT4930769.1 hypothetical protein [Flavobacteriales bacterium]
MKRIETTSTIYTLEGNVLISKLKSNHNMTVQDTVENYEARQTLDLRYPMLALMDLRHLSGMDFKAIMAMNDQREADLISAAAMVLGKPIHYIIAKEARRFRKYKFPVKVFKDYDKAMSWLMEHS